MAEHENILDRLRQPEYTGENRCLACTLVNSVIALALAAAVAVRWLPAGALALVVFFAAIYLRGYLVPGTPELTKQYFPPWLLELFGKESVDDQLRTEGVTQPDTAAGERDHDAGETEELLRSAGVVEDCTGEDDLCLTGQFGEDWWGRIRQFRADDERAAAQLAAVLDVDPEAIEFVEDQHNFGVTYQGELAAQWDSDATFYADLAAEPTLAEWLPEWDGLDDQTRTELLAGMRAFLEQCPACDAELDQVENVRKSCCAGELVSVTVACDACGARVFSGSYA